MTIHTITDKRVLCSVFSKMSTVLCVHCVADQWPFVKRCPRFSSLALALYILYIELHCVADQWPFVKRCPRFSSLALALYILYIELYDGGGHRCRPPPPFSCLYFGRPDAGVSAAFVLQQGGQQGKRRARATGSATEASGSRLHMAAWWNRALARQSH